MFILISHRSFIRKDELFIFSDLIHLPTISCCLICYIWIWRAEFVSFIFSFKFFSKEYAFLKLKFFFFSMPIFKWYKLCSLRFILPYYFSSLFEIFCSELFCLFINSVDLFQVLDEKVHVLRFMLLWEHSQISTQNMQHCIIAHVFYKVWFNFSDKADK